MRNFAIFVLSCTAMAALAAPPDPADGVAAIAADVFVSNGGGGLMPVNVIQTPPEAPLYAFSGQSLGFTWGQWSSATATSAVHCAGGKTRAKFDISGLIPGGVYSIFSGTFTPDSQNPVCPAEHLVAVVESFTADAGGGARLHAESDGCLLDATEVSYVVIYHLDGQTWGAVPSHGEAVDCRSSFGSDAFRHLFIQQKAF